LKASLLHDLLEDLPETQVDEIRWIDHESNQVVDLVLEVTKQKEETKFQFLQRLLNSGSYNAMLLKCADRISNLTDLHRDTHTEQKITDYLDQTEQFVIPMARKVNADMVIELTDLVVKRRGILRMMEDSKLRE
jgi:(p)ppGpp synthase/HD superfamily hydrolase